MRDGENQVMVRAPDEPRTLAFEPLLGGEPLALRAAALMTRVVERALDMSCGTAAHVATELGRAAV